MKAWAAEVTNGWQSIRMNAFQDQLLTDTLKTREHENWIQQLLEDAKKSNLRLTGVSEKSEDNTKT